MKNISINNQKPMTEKEIKNLFFGYFSFTFFIALILFLIVSKIMSNGDAGSFMQGVFGSAVALAGAYVAIRLAAIAINYQNNQNEMVNDQLKREKLQAQFEMLNVVSAHVEGSLKPLVSIVMGIQSVYKMAIFISMDFEKIMKLEDKNKQDVAINAFRHDRTEKLQSELEKLMASCESSSILTNPIAAFLVSEYGKKNFEFKLQQVSVSDMGLWDAMFENFATNVRELNSLDNNNFMNYIFACKYYNRHVVSIENGPFDNIALRDLLFLNTLLSGPLATNDLNDQAADIFSKFISHLPNGEDIVSGVKKLFPPETIGDELTTAMEKFDINAGIDVSFKMAITAYDENKPLKFQKPADSTSAVTSI